MITYPNQRIIDIHTLPHKKEKTVEDQQNRWGCLDRDAAAVMSKVFVKTTPATILLYLDLVLNRNGFKVALSPKELQDRLGISKDQYDKAVDNLIHAGYLIEQKPGNHRYDFYELPEQYAREDKSKLKSIANTSRRKRKKRSEEAASVSQDRTGEDGMLEQGMTEKNNFLQYGPGDAVSPKCTHVTAGDTSAAIAGYASWLEQRMLPGQNRGEITQDMTDKTIHSTRDNDPDDEDDTEHIDFQDIDFHHSRKHWTANDFTVFAERNGQNFDEDIDMPF